VRNALAPSCSGPTGIAMKARIWVTLYASLALASSAACDAGAVHCNKRIYPEGFELTLVRRAWEPASYLFEGETDRGGFVCTLGLDHTASCEPASVTFGLVPHGNTTLSFGDRPTNVVIRAYRDGELLGEGRYVPDYARDEPNGEGCGVRVFASDVWDLPGPAPCGTDESCRCVYDDGCDCDYGNVPAAPWSACGSITVRSDDCVPSCTCLTEPGLCVASCDQAVIRRRALCAGGSWSCADPGFPIALEDCVTP
jgi:hypothetical protein